MKTLTPLQPYAVYVHWRSQYQGKREFMILWSDHTWSMVTTPIEEGWLKNGKSLKTFMNLRNIVDKKMTRLEVEKYLKTKYAEYDAINK